MAIRGSNVIPMPDEVSFVQGALLEPLCVALNAVERIHPRPARPRWSWALAPSACLWWPCCRQAYGIKKVLCSGLANDVKRLEVAEKLGAITINGSECDVVEKVKELTGGKGPEMILDAAGHFTVVQQAVEMVAKGGRIGITGLPAEALDHPDDPHRDASDQHYRLARHERKHWRQALNLMANGLDISLVSNFVLPLSDWKKGMELIDAGEGLRVILEP